MQVVSPLIHLRGANLCGLQPLRALPDVGDALVRQGIDADKRQVRLADRDVALTAKEFDLLLHFARNPGRVYTRGQLVDKVMGPTAMVGDRNIDVHIGAVRKKLGPYRELLETVRGVGYRFKA